MAGTEDYDPQTSIFLKNALDDRARKGPESQMYRLVEKQLRKRSDFSLTRKLYLAVVTLVTQVVQQRHYEDLVSAIFCFDYMIKANNMKNGNQVEIGHIRDAFEVCARALVSANATLAAPCLRSLSKTLLMVAQAASSSGSSSAASAARSAAASEDGAANAMARPTMATSDAPEKKLDEAEASALRKRIVALMVGVVGLVPTAPSLIGPALADNFPHRFRDAQCLQCYAKAVLSLASRVPLAAVDCVRLLLERCLEIDVEIKVDEATGQAVLVGGAAKAHEDGERDGTPSKRVAGGGGSESEHEGEDEDLHLGFGAPKLRHSAQQQSTGGSLAAFSPSSKNRQQRSSALLPGNKVKNGGGNGSGDESGDDAGKEAAAVPVRVSVPLRVDEMAEKLDFLMVELFKFIDSALVIPRQQSGDAAKSGGHHSGVGAIVSATAAVAARDQQTDDTNVASTALATAPCTPFHVPGGGGGAVGSTPFEGSSSGSISSSSKVGSGGSGGGGGVSRLWRALLGSFEERILLTHRAKFVQFLVFRFCALSSHHSSSSRPGDTPNSNSNMNHGKTFALKLTAAVLDARAPHVKRRNAVQFLASFAVRAKLGLEPSVLVSVMEALLGWVETQLAPEEKAHSARAATKAPPTPLPSSCSGSATPQTPHSFSAFSSAAKSSAGGRGESSAMVASAGLLDPSELINHRLGVLYAVTQALFYIVCFKGRELHAAASTAAAATPATQDASTPAATPLPQSSTSLPPPPSSLTSSTSSFCSARQTSGNSSTSTGSVSSTSSGDGATASSSEASSPSRKRSLSSTGGEAASSSSFTSPTPRTVPPSFPPPPLPLAAAADAAAATALQRLLDSNRWRRLCESPLQPLAFCIDRVRAEFLNLAKRLGLLPPWLASQLEHRSDAAIASLASAAGLCLGGHRSSKKRVGGGSGVAFSSSAMAAAAATPRHHGDNTRATPSSSAPCSGAPSSATVVSPPVLRRVFAPVTPGNALKRTPSSSQRLTTTAHTPFAPASSSSALAANTSNTPHYSNVGSSRKKLNGGSVSSVSGLGEFNRANPLESFFPFDPYLLRLSHSYVADIYNEWEDHPDEDDDYDDDGDDCEETTQEDLLSDDNGPAHAMSILSVGSACGDDEGAMFGFGNGMKDDEQKEAGDDADAGDDDDDDEEGDDDDDDDEIDDDEHDSDDDSNEDSDEDEDAQKEGMTRGRSRAESIGDW